MPRPRFRSIDAPWLRDEEPDWQGMTKADAIREASKLLDGERSPIQIVRFLEQRDVKVSSPQAAKVLGDLSRRKKPKPSPENLAHSVQAVVAIQKFAAEQGGIEAVTAKLADAENIINFANEIGGLEVLKAILQQLQAAR